jgi:gamma-glutamyltranspeptidase / glutathione hydrolase
MKRLAVGILALQMVVMADPPTFFPPVRGTREMVAAANNFQVEAGWRVLMAGGNAVDAGVAAILSAMVTEQSRIGLGGEMPLLIKMAGKPPVAISGIGTAPDMATPDYFLKRSAEPWEDPAHFPPIPAQGLRAAIVPGAFDGLMLALTKYGTKSYCEVSAPAIEAARGFPLPDEYARFIAGSQDILMLWPDSAAFFLPNGEPPKRGEIFRAPSLANTLISLCAAEQKASGTRDQKIQAVRDEFYRGGLAKKLAAFSEAHGGLIRAHDLASFHAKEDSYASVKYRGYEIVKPGFWTQGPVMLEALNMLEGYDLKRLGHNSPQYLHIVIEVVKLAFADRDQYYGDPDFSTIPSATLLSKEYAAERRKLVDPQLASMDHRPGLPGATSPPPGAPGATEGAHDTTCVNVVDQQGNVFSATPSGAWLPSVIAGDTGVPFSTRLQSFVVTPGHANELLPGKRPRVTLSPTLVLKDGKPWLAMSTPGGDNQDQAMLQVLLNIIEFGMGPQEAVEAPRFQTEHFYSSFANHEFTPGKVNIEARIPEITVRILQEKGHRVMVTGPWSNGSAPTLILIRDGVLDGGADPRRSRYVFGR